MSTVSASNSNPYAFTQATWQRAKSQSSATQGDAASQPSPATGPASATTAVTTTVVSPGSAKSTSSGGFPRFEPQTLQTLLAVQANGS